MAAIYSNGGYRWNILGFNFTKRDALSSVYKISMLNTHMYLSHRQTLQNSYFDNSHETAHVKEEITSITTYPQTTNRDLTILGRRRPKQTPSNKWQ